MESRGLIESVESELVFAGKGQNFFGTRQNEVRAERTEPEKGKLDVAVQAFEDTGEAVIYIGGRRVYERF